MLYDRYMDDLIDAFEAGFAEASKLPSECPFDQSDAIRHTAWLDGANYSTPSIAEHLYCREAIVPAAPYVPCLPSFRQGRPFVRASVLSDRADK